MSFVFERHQTMQPRDRVNRDPAAFVNSPGLLSKYRHMRLMKARI